VQAVPLGLIAGNGRFPCLVLEAAHAQGRPVTVVAIKDEAEPALVAAAQNADVVIGSRYLNGVSVVNWPLHRIFLSAFANRYIRAVTQLSPSDCTSGFRCWRREALARLPLDTMVSDGYAFLVEMLFDAARNGSRIAEVPIIFVERRQGQSKLSSNVIFESIIMPWRLTLRGARR